MSIYRYSFWFLNVYERGALLSGAFFLFCKIFLTIFVVQTKSLNYDNTKKGQII